MQVAEFRILLQERCVSCFFIGNMHHLEKLSKLANEMNLEVITTNVDFDTYKNFDLSRRTI